MEAARFRTPEGGKANDAIVILLADTLQVSQRDISGVAGHAARDKVVAVTGIDSDETDRRLALAAETVRNQHRKDVP